MRSKTSHTERIIPAETPAGIVALHLKRYQFALKHITGHFVLDVACGAGYGASYLAESGIHVIGADIDRQALSYAKKHYCGPKNLTFIQADGMRAAFADCQFDAICSFETIEHLADVHLFLREVKRMLIPGGIFIISTPRVLHSNLHPTNPYHYREWSPADFKGLLCSYFKSVELFGQYHRVTRTTRLLKRLDIFSLRKWLFPLWLTRWAAHVLGVRTMADLELEDVLIRRGDLHRANEIVAIACDEN